MSLRTPLVEHPEQLREGCEVVMKMSSEGGDTRFPDNLRVRAMVVTGWGHKKKGVETLGRVAVKINGKGQKLWRRCAFWGPCLKSFCDRGSRSGDQDPRNKIGFCNRCVALHHATVTACSVC